MPAFNRDFLKTLTIGFSNLRSIEKPGMGLIRKASRLLKEITLVTRYNSFIYPYLQYDIMA